jgi:hypothetical protein
MESPKLKSQLPVSPSVFFQISNVAQAAHPEVDLAKFGYKQTMKVEAAIFVGCQIFCISFLTFSLLSIHFRKQD